MAEIKKFYSLEEIADMLQVTKRTLYNYIYSGKLRATKVGKYWRVSPESLQTFLDGQTTNASGGSGADAE